MYPVVDVTEGGVAIIARSQDAANTWKDPPRMSCVLMFFFFSSRRRHTRCSRDWSSDVCSSDLETLLSFAVIGAQTRHQLFVQVDARCRATDQNQGQPNLQEAFHVISFPFDEEIGRASCRERV